MAAPPVTHHPDSPLAVALHSALLVLMLGLGDAGEDVPVGTGVELLDFSVCWESDEKLRHLELPVSKYLIEKVTDDGELKLAGPEDPGCGSKQAAVPVCMTALLSESLQVRSGLLISAGNLPILKTPMCPV